jgi:hypothetical protein
MVKLEIKRVKKQYDSDKFHELQNNNKEIWILSALTSR